MMRQFFQFLKQAVAVVAAAAYIPMVSAESNVPRTLTLDEAITIARTNSVDAAVALDELKSAYWEYRTYRADLLPELSFRGTVPSYRKQYGTYMNSDGSYTFVPNDYIQMNGELGVKQNIWFTGGTLSLITSLDFLRQLSGTQYNRFMSVPVALTLEQPLFGTNHTKWNRKIEPVRYKEAKAAFMSATENVAISVINLYFSLLMARENLHIAMQNQENAVKLYEVALEKRSMGQISKNDLLQMELNLLEARSYKTDCESGWRNAMFQLVAFLDLPEDTVIEPVVPTEIPDAEIGYREAYDKAIANNSFAQNQLRRQLEAQYAIAKAKGDMRQINLFAQIGFTGTSHNVARSYSGLRDNQVVEIGFEIPLVDWGKRRGRVKVAESNSKVTESKLRQEAMTFSQDLFMLVERYSNQRQQLQISAKSDTIAAKRYDTNVQTYLIGQLSTLDLNDSQVKKDEARRGYVNELFKYWLYYYQIRSLTLWDFATDQGIEADIDAICK